MESKSIKGNEMKKYLTALIEEKGIDLEKEIVLEGHIGLTYDDLIFFIEGTSKEIKASIRSNLVAIDFKNGDVFAYLDHLAKGMVAALYGEEA